MQMVRDACAPASTSWQDEGTAEDIVRALDTWLIGCGGDCQDGDLGHGLSLDDDLGH